MPATVPYLPSVNGTTTASAERRGGNETSSAGVDNRIANDAQGEGASGSTIHPAGPVLTFIAHGTPIGQGNIRHLGKGRPAIHQNANTLLPWRDTIRHAAITAIGDSAGFPYDEPLRIDATFTVPKPTGAPKTRRVWPSKRPDLDHMIRAALDAITHVVVTDDARVVELHAAKRYPLEGADALTYPGVIVRVYRLTHLTGTP